MLGRRKFIGVAASLAAFGCGGPEPDVSQARVLDFTKPEDNLYALLKLMGDISGKRTYYYQPGRVFLHRDGKLPLHILNYGGATVREIRQVDDATYISRFSGWQLFRDPETNAIIDVWTNRETRTRHTVKHFAFPNRKQVFSAAGLKAPEGFKGEFLWFDKPLVLPWRTLGDEIWAPYDQFSRYTNREGEERYENAIHTYKGRLSDLQNGAITSAASSIASQSQSPFYPWLEFGEMDGHLIASSLGTKSSSIDLYPTDFMEDMAKRHPGEIDAAFNWDGA